MQTLEKTPTLFSSVSAMARKASINSNVRGIRT